MNKTQALELLHCNVREKPQFGMGKRNGSVKNLNQNLGQAKGMAVWVIVFAQASLGDKF